jgi:hypothetical protein
MAQERSTEQTPLRFRRRVAYASDSDRVVNDSLRHEIEPLRRTSFKLQRVDRRLSTAERIQASGAAKVQAKSCAKAEAAESATRRTAL